jgi:uncharacterized membrane protein
MQVTDRVDATRAWVGTALAAVAALVVGSFVFTERVYWGFVWQYFWGPVYADANNAVCAVHDGSGTGLRSTGQACRAAVEQGHVVAEPGYTLVSEVGYMAILLFMLVGVYLLVRGLGIGADRDVFYALVPFMLFGGALRVVEDANDAVVEGASQALSYPWNAFIISPVIYFTVFVVTLVALVVTKKLAERGSLESYTVSFGLVGVAAFLLTFAYLLYLAATTEFVAFHVQVLVVVVGTATLLAVAVFRGVDRFAPAINDGTGNIGLVVIWGHAIDGVANVVAADWMGALGLDLAYSPKHPANEFVIEATEAVLPASLAGSLGTSWPFLLVKLLVAVAVVWIFDEEIFEDSPRYALLLLTAIVAVGLGPGTRDMIRATFGI